MGAVDDIVTAFSNTIGGLPLWALLALIVFLVVIILIAVASLKKIPCPNCSFGNKRGDALCRECFSPLDSGAYKPPKST